MIGCVEWQKRKRGADWLNEVLLLCAQLSTRPSGWSHEHFPIPDNSHLMGVFGTRKVLMACDLFKIQQRRKTQAGSPKPLLNIPVWCSFLRRCQGARSRSEWTNSKSHLQELN